NPAGRFSQVVATIGGQENAFTAADYTGYFQRVPRDQLQTMMEFEADRMTGLVLTDEVVRPELNVVLEEQNMRVANNPAARLADPRVTQPSLSRYYLVPSSTTARAGESEALDVLTHILGHGANSRLYQTLVVDKAIAVSAGASYDGTAVDNTRLSVFATPKPG